MPGLLIFIGIGIIFMTVLKASGRRKDGRRNDDQEREGGDGEHR